MLHLHVLFETPSPPIIECLDCIGRFYILGKHILQAEFKPKEPKPSDTSHQNDRKNATNKPDKKIVQKARQKLEKYGRVSFPNIACPDFMSM